MSEGNKRPYEPSTRKRFEISKDRFSQERIRFLKDAHAELKKEIPGITVAFCLFGSLAKGKRLNSSAEAGASDIDVAFYVDNDEFVQRYYQIIEKNRGGRLAAIHTRNIAQAKAWLRSKMTECVSSSPEFHCLQKFLIEFMKDRWSRWPNKKLKGEEDSIPQFLQPGNIGLMAYPIAESGVHSIYKTVEQAADRGYVIEMLTMGMMDPHFFVYHLFALDVGGNMRKYRVAFFKQLAATEKKKAEAMWQTVIESIYENERYNKVTSEMEKMLPPKDLDEALKKYLG